MFSGNPTPIRVRVPRAWLTRPAPEALVLAGLSGFSWARRTAKPATAAQLAEILPGLAPSTVGRVLTRLVSAGLVTRERTGSSTRTPYVYQLAPGAIPAKGWAFVPVTALRLSPGQFRVASALVYTRGNQAAAARLLGVSRRAVCSALAEIRSTRGGVNLDDIRMCEAGRHPSRARGTEQFSVQTKERSADAGKPADGARSHASGTAERRTAPPTLPSRSSGLRTPHPSPELPPLAAPARTLLERCGFGSYRFRTPADRDRIGALCVEVSGSPGRHPWAVVWRLLQNGTHAGLRARVEWAGLCRGERVEVDQTEGRLTRRVVCSCGHEFGAPLDWGGSCPECGRLEGAEATVVTNEEDAALGADLVSGLAGAFGQRLEGRVSEDAERAAQLAAFAERASVPTPARRLAEQVAPTAAPASSGAEELRRRFAAMGAVAA